MPDNEGDLKPDNEGDAQGLLNAGSGLARPGNSVAGGLAAGLWAIPRR